MSYQPKEGEAVCIVDMHVKDAYFDNKASIIGAEVIYVRDAGRFSQDGYVNGFFKREDSQKEFDFIFHAVQVEPL